MAGSEGLAAPIEQRKTEAVETWASIGALAAAVQALVVVAAAFYAFGQVREARRIGDLTTLIHLYSTIDSDTAIEDRRMLHNELPEDITTGLSKEQFALVYRVVTVFTFLGDLVAKGLLDFELIANTHARPISRNWQRLEPWVRAQQGREPWFAKSFEALGAKCAAWDMAHHGEANMARPYRHAD